MEDLIGEFLSHIEVEQRCSPHTVLAYGHDLRQFADWRDDSDACTVTAGEIRSWIGSLADEGMAPATLRRKTESLRAFYHWGRRTGRFAKNPAADVILVKKNRSLPNFIKESEMEELLSAPRETFDEERTHIALTLLYSLGLRQAELLALTDDDVDFSAQEIRVTGKRNKQRIVPMPDSLAEEIKLWQSTRDARYPDLAPPRAIIAGPHGGLSKVALYKAVRDALAGVSTGRKSPHTLRHSFATAMINNGADLDAVREMLGHESLATTQVYTHLSVKELMKNYRQCHPRSKK